MAYSFVGHFYVVNSEKRKSRQKAAFSFWRKPDYDAAAAAGLRATSFSLIRADLPERSRR
jgi:hypothetical protein